IVEHSIDTIWRESGDPQFIKDSWGEPRALLRLQYQCVRVEINRRTWDVCISKIADTRHGDRERNRGRARRRCENHEQKRKGAAEIDDVHYEAFLCSSVVSSKGWTILNKRAAGWRLLRIEITVARVAKTRLY